MRPNTARAPIVTAHATRLEALLELLVEEVRGLRADFARQRGAVDDRGALLAPIAGYVKGTAFSAAEVIHHAAVVASPLREALAAAGVVNARQLGKWFRRIEGRDIGGLRLTRIGVDRDGVIWRVCECENPQTRAVSSLTARMRV